MKKHDAEAALLRRELDEILKRGRKFRPVMPKRGWIHTVREALCMTTTEMAKRMGVSPAAIVAMERSEAKQVMRLETLQRAARALECKLVYALVPRHSLERVIEVRRRRVTVADMALVLKNSNGEEYRDLIKEYGKRIKRSRLWKDVD